MSKNVG